MAKEGKSPRAPLKESAAVAQELEAVRRHVVALEERLAKLEKKGK